MSKIIKLEAKEILDSRKTPTVSVSCVLDDGSEGNASVPSGASTGKYEAWELRDNDSSRFGGKGVEKAVQNINGEIFNFLKNKDLDQESLDHAMIEFDHTENKSLLGANAILGVSIAFAKACAKQHKIELYEHIGNIYFGNKEKRNYKLPQPAFNIINGGKHADNNLPFQEFLIIPEKFDTLKVKVEVAHKIIDKLREVLLSKGDSVSLGDEGGFAPKLSSNEEALDCICKAILGADLDFEKVKIGIDVAATSFFKEGYYFFGQQKLNAEDLFLKYEEIVKKYPIFSIEDGFQEEDFENFTKLKKILGKKIRVIGDDLVVTNVSLIKKAIEKKAVDTVIIKPNQIGSLSETLLAIKTAKENNIKIFISHRSGETLDTFISDLAVAVGADFIKAGAPTRPERIAKYDRLIQIENLIS